MPHNQIKSYNSCLEIIHLNPAARDISLRAVFDRDIANNESFKFRTKIIRPLKTEGQENLDVLFDHLTRESVHTTDKNGKNVKQRNENK